MGTQILYQGHGSLRITAPDGYVIYIDPFAGDGYGEPADLILVTHQHRDHNALELPARGPHCAVRQNFDFLKDGEYLSGRFGAVNVRATQAYNRNHSRGECVGYILELDGKKIYVAGDTSRTEQMETMAAEGFDLAFLPVDGIYNMDTEEASVCAKLIGAKRTVPYHTAPGKLFDRAVAERFSAPGRLILAPGETLTL